MVTYDFLERQPELVKEFYESKGLIEPSLYLIAVGAFEDEKLVEVFTVTKPPMNGAKYTFKLNSYQADKYAANMLGYFHSMYDGLIEGLE